MDRRNISGIGKGVVGGVDAKFNQEEDIRDAK
jgi:hypothetical protein